MKLFLSLRKIMSVVGFQPSSSIQTNLLNWKSLLAFVCILKFAILTIAALVFEAKHFEDYAECFYAITTGLLVISNFSKITFKTRKIFQLIDIFEITIQKRKSNFYDLRIRNLYYKGPFTTTEFRS